MKHISLILCVILLLSSFALASSANDAPSCTEGFVCGDANSDGAVNAKDVSAFLKFLAGFDSDVDKSHMDTNCDGKTNGSDCAYMLKFLAEWDGIYRLGHKDEYKILRASDVANLGEAEIVCSVCGNSIKKEIPYKTITICGVPISEYTIVYETMTTGLENLEINAILLDFLEKFAEVFGEELETKKATTSKELKSKAAEHEILIGRFDREGIADYGTLATSYGVTENGTVYIRTSSLGGVYSVFDEICHNYFGCYFYQSRKVCSEDVNIEPFEVSYAEEFQIPDGYTLAFEDNFDGDSLDLTKWTYRNESGNISPSQISVRDGNLVITNEYREDGEKGPGWYAGSIKLAEKRLRGYFEIRCKIIKNSYGFRNAFWLQGASPYKCENSQGGIGPGGCELDILENFNDCNTFNLYCSGVDGYTGTSFQSYNSGNIYAGDLNNEYHTYGLLWDEEYYYFFIDRILVGKTCFGEGTATYPEDVIVCTCIGPGAGSDDLTVKQEFLVDYVKIWQKN